MFICHLFLKQQKHCECKWIEKLTLYSFLAAINMLEFSFGDGGWTINASIYYQWAGGIAGTIFQGLEVQQFWLANEFAKFLWSLPTPCVEPKLLLSTEFCGWQPSKFL